MTFDLEHFRLKSLDLGQLTGASMALHAIPDAYFLKHTGVGCKHKTVTQFGTHDWAKGVAAHEGWTEVGDAALIRGSGRRVGPYARSAYQRHKPSILAISSVTFLDLTGDDLPDVVAGLDAELPCEVMLLKVPGFEGDLYSGYLTTLVEVCRRMDWSVAPDRAQEVAVLGYLWDRYEGDHQGNQLQLKALLQAIGLSLGPVLFSGTPYTALRDAPRSKTVLCLPYAEPKRKTLQRVCKRDLVSVDLPIGRRFTSQFLRVVASAAGVAGATVEGLIARQETALGERLGTMVDHLRGQSVAVFADLPLLAGTMATLEELGIRVVIAGIRGRTLGKAADLEAALARVGAAVPAGCQVVDQPSLARVRALCADAIAAGTLDGVLGSATDLNALGTLPASTPLRRSAGTASRTTGPFKLEIGFPCRDHHCAYAMPFMGYMGVSIFVQRLLTAPRLWDTGVATRV